MHVRCLSAQELENWLLDWPGSIESQEFRALREASQDFAVEIAGVTYFLVQLVLRHRDRPDSVKVLLQKFATQNQHMWFTAEDCGVVFIDFLLRNRRRSTLSLSEEIAECVEDCIEHRYSKTVRM